MSRIPRYIAYLLIFVFFAVLFFGIFISRYDLQLRSNLLINKHPKFHDYRGITHVLSAHSQGGGALTEVIENAAKAQVDYIYLTDLNDFDPNHEIFGYNDNVLVMSGKKVSYLDSQFLLYSRESLRKFDSLGAAQALISDFLNRVPTDTKDVTVVLAHPFKPGHEWTSEYPEGLNGIEVMNLRQMWQQKWLTQKASFVWSLFLYIFNPKIALIRMINEPLPELALWDKLNEKRKTLGLIGNQSTGKIFTLGILSVSFPTYEDSFRFSSNHILLKSELTGVGSRDMDKIHQAFVNGNFYFSVDALANPRGFAAYMSNGTTDFLMGDSIRWSPDLKLMVDLPKLNAGIYEIKVYKNGKEVLSSRELNTVWQVKEPGVYRVYARIRLQLPIPGELRWVPWIYTNNFYVN